MENEMLSAQTHNLAEKPLSYLLKGILIKYTSRKFLLCMLFNCITCYVMFVDGERLKETATIYFIVGTMILNTVYVFSSSKISASLKYGDKELNIKDN
jgi:hypothetical protein